MACTMEPRSLAILLLLVLVVHTPSAEVINAEEMATTFLHMLGLAEAPVVNRSRAVEVPEYVLKMYKDGRDGYELEPSGMDREVRAIAATQVSQQARHVDVIFYLTPAQASVFANSHLQKLLFSWDITKPKSSRRTPVKVSACDDSGVCFPAVKSRHEVFTGRKDNSDILDITKVLRLRTTSESHRLSHEQNNIIRLRLKSNPTGNVGIFSQRPKDVFLMLFRNVPRMHNDPLEGNDDKAAQAHSLNRVRRSTLSKKIRKHAPLPTTVTPDHTVAPDQAVAPGCQLFEWYLKFEDLGWGDWILQPRGFMANHCSGQCSSLGNGTDNFTNHAYLRSVFLKLVETGQLQREASVQPIYCVPVRLNPISLIFLTNDVEIVHRFMTEMAAVSCACL